MDFSRRAWMQHNAKDCQVLNLFAYTCAFSVAAMEVIFVIVILFFLDDSILAHTIFKSWCKLTRLSPYDVVVADPPSYKKGFVATNDHA
jgi:23S rRNA (cytosine1962-C5)-methyltransferase